MSDLALFGGSAVRTKPFPHWPVFDESEEKALVEVVRSGQWWRYSMGEAVDGAGAANGARSKVGEFQEMFAQVQGARYGIACATGTGAIEVVLKAMGIGQGDEVIVPPYTFVATATAPMLIGATPIFCDIDLATLNLDPARLEEAITPQTKAVMPVHFAGLAADMEAILAICARHGIPVVEDACHGHGGAWNGRGLGTIGMAGTFSFQASKNMTAGEGGLITTDDASLAELCESYIWVGRKTGRPWYEHHYLGWNYRLTEFQGAILIEQLRRLGAQTERRQSNAFYLNERLKAIPGIHPLQVPAYATRHACHIYVFRFDESEFGISRADFLQALAAEGIPAIGGYAHPLYRNPLFQDPALDCDYSQFAALCPNSERACREMVWLEHRLLLGDQADMDDVVAAIRKVHHCRPEFESASAGTVATR
ncbi:MAG: DegT/DnrJ/EryC1/StrS family aminotransferase [Acidobacteria bacterium]|nr:DegT/DnrJ/EryC1/StrS family aminotransferase [Acidobacteriota bacterium]